MKTKMETLNTLLSMSIISSRWVGPRRVVSSRSRVSSHVRATSYEPSRPGWLGFWDLASPHFSLQKFRCVHMKRRAGPVTEISVFATEISVTELEILPMWTLQPGYRDCLGRNIFNCAWFVRSLTSRNADYTGILGAFWTFFISVTGIKFPQERIPIWTEDKIRPAYRARGPFLESPGNLSGPISYRTFEKRPPARLSGSYEEALGQG